MDGWMDGLGVGGMDGWMDGGGWAGLWIRGLVHGVFHVLSSHTSATQHDIVRDAALDVGEGRILLCPSDSPLQWMAALGEATPRVR